MSIAGDKHIHDDNRHGDESDCPDCISGIEGGDWTIESPDGEFEPCLASEWFAANALLPEEDLRAVLNLHPGQTHSAGGGAGAEWTVRRAR